MATIIPFPVRSGAWAHDERDLLTTLQHMLEECGLPTSFEAGVTDEADPWAVFFGRDDGHALAHVARCRSGVFLVWADGNVVRARGLASLVAGVRRAIDHGQTPLRRRR